MKLKKYNTKSHKYGGLLIDNNGNPIKGKNKPVAEVEKKESLLSMNGRNYVFSDALNTSKKASKIESDFPNDNVLSKAAKRRAFLKLKRLNELKKRAAELGNPDNDSRSKSADKIYEKELGGDIINSTLGALPDFIDELKPKDDLYDAFSNSVSNLVPKMFNGGDPVPDKLPSLDINPVSQGLVGSNAVMRPDRRDIPMDVPNKLPSVFDSKVPIAPELQDTNSRGSTFFERLKENLGNKTTNNDRADLVRGISTVGSAINAYRSADKETPRFVNFSEGDTILKDSKIDPQAAINESNLAFNTANYLAKDSSRNSSQYFNRLRANAARAGQRGSQIELEADKFNTQIDLQLASRADRKAASVAGEQTRIDIANSQNLAKSRDLQQQFLNTLYDTGTALDKKRYLEEAVTKMNDAQQKQFLLNLAMLNQQSTNFKVDSKVLNDFMKNPDSYDVETIMNELVKYKK